MTEVGQLRHVWGMLWAIEVIIVIVGSFNKAVLPGWATVLLATAMLACMTSIKRIDKVLDAHDEP